MDEVTTKVDTGGGLVVGHDGSPHADRALVWAADWAKRAGCALHVVRTWTLSTSPRPDSWEPGFAPPMTDFEQAVRAALEKDVAALALPGPAPTCHVLHGSAARRLVEVSRTAELIAISARGRGGFAGLVMGATTDQVVRHSRCPVVVVPAGALDDEPAAPDRAMRQDP